jgi:hypothetical protein
MKFEANATYDKICVAIERVDSIETMEEFCTIHGVVTDGLSCDFEWKDYNEVILDKVAKHYGFRYKMIKEESRTTGLYYTKTYPDDIVNGYEYIIKDYGGKGRKAYCFDDVKYYDLKEI